MSRNPSADSAREIASSDTEVAKALGVLCLWSRTGQYENGQQNRDGTNVILRLCFGEVEGALLNSQVKETIALQDER